MRGRSTASGNELMRPHRSVPRVQYFRSRETSVLAQNSQHTTHSMSLSRLGALVDEKRISKTEDTMLIHQQLKMTNERVDMLHKKQAQMSESIDSHREELNAMQMMIQEKNIETRQWTESYVAEVLRKHGLGQACI